jgi:hypothetical protein
VDGCLRVEKTGAFGIGGVLGTPVDGTEALVVLQYDGADDGTTSFALLDLAGLTDAMLRTVVPLAYVQVTGGTMIVRDARRLALGKWRVRHVAQSYHGAISGNGGTPTLLCPAGATVANSADLGGFVLRAGEGVLLRAAVTVSNDEVSGLQHQPVYIAPSHANSADLTLAHAWPSSLGLGVAVDWCPAVGQAVRHLGNLSGIPTITTGHALWQMYYEHLMVPKIDANAGSLTLPGWYDFNGFCTYAGSGRSYNYTQLTLAAQVVAVRGSDVVQTAPQWWRAGDPTNRPPTSPYTQIQG